MKHIYIIILIATLILSCTYPVSDNGLALEEQQSVWQYLNVYSIFRDRLPAQSGALTPADMFDLIADTLRGGRYTGYAEGGGGGGGERPPIAPPVGLDDGVTVYYRIPDFMDEAQEHFIESVEAMQGYENIIIDLRGNGGGFLRVADAMISEFLPFGTEFIYTRYRRYDSRQRAGVDAEGARRAINQAPRLLGKNIAVIINAGSASASEIMVAALKDRAGAVIVGPERSHGKGIGQVLVNRPNRPKLEQKSLRITFLEIEGVRDGEVGEYHTKGIPPDPVNEEYMEWAASEAPDDFYRYIYYAMSVLNPDVVLEQAAGQLRRVSIEPDWHRSAIGVYVEVDESELIGFFE